MCSYLSLRVTSEGLHNLPDSGDNPHGVAAHHEHHYVHTDAGQQDLTPAHILLLPQWSARLAGAGRGHLSQVVHVALYLSEIINSSNSSISGINLSVQVGQMTTWAERHSYNILLHGQKTHSNKYFKVFNYSINRHTALSFSVWKATNPLVTTNLAISFVCSFSSKLIRTT